MDVEMADAAFMPTGYPNLKRQRSGSLDQDRPVKQVKVPERSIVFDGLEVKNPLLGVLNEKGDVVPWTPPQTVIAPTGLPTPMVENEDPLAKGSVLLNPTVPESYVITGDIELFGFVDAKIAIFQGKLTAGHPDSEVVTPSKQSFSLSSLVPSLEGSVLDAIALENTQFRYSEVTFDVFQSAGLYLHTDVVFQGPLQPVADTLKSVFHQENPALHVSAYLGSRRSWTRPVLTKELVLRGSLENVSVNVLDLLTVTNIGVELAVQRGLDLETSEPEWQFGYGFFGDLNLKVPGSVVPLQVRYSLRLNQGEKILDLLLKDDEWTDVFGVKGLSVTNVQLSAVFADGQDLQFSIEAAMQWKDSQLFIGGSYSQSSYSLEVYIGHMTLQDLGDFFERLTGANLDVFDHDIQFDSISLRVSSEGAVLSGSITVNGYTANGTVAISEDGLSIKGGVGDISFEHFLVANAQLDLFIGSDSKAAGARSTKFRLVGDLSFEGFNLKAGLYVSSGKSSAWTVFAAADGDMSTSSLCKELKGTFLDISLKRLAFIASNEESPKGDFNDAKYPISKGVQFCAMIDDIPELSALLRGSVKGMILRAAYSSGSFALSIILPGERTISFGDNVYTGPLALEIQTEGNLSLVLKAVLNVKLDTQPDPLAFSMGLKANAIGATAYASMIGDWINPCNVGRNVKISACAMEFGIVYTQFFATGTPGVIGFAGQLNIGKKEAKVAMKLSSNPKEQLISASVTDLGVVDLVKFASVVTDSHLPEPDNFLHFNYADLYMSTGATIGEIRYPAGASFKGDMTIFGKRAKFECTIGALVKILATIEHFELGPLKVKGATGADPIVDVELSSSTQKVLIDGAVEIWGASAALHLAADIYPSPTFDFWVDMRLSDLFVFKLEAQLTGKFNLKDLSSLKNADFKVHGLMEQHLIEYIMQQLENQVEAARDVLKMGFDVVTKELEAQEKKFQEGCQKALDALEAARAVWQRKRDAVNGEFAKAKAEAEAKKKELRGKVDEAERNFKRLVANAIHDLEVTEAKARAAIADAQRAVNDAERDADNSIGVAQMGLDFTKKEFDRQFGSAQRDLENARQKARDAYNAVDVLDSLISQKDRDIDNAFWPWEKADAWIERTALVVAKEGAKIPFQIAQGAVWAAEGIVQGTGYVTSEAAIGVARLQLEAVRAAKTAALQTARGTLTATEATQSGFIRAAQETLRTAETASDELHIFDAAKAALEAGNLVAQGMIDAAQTSVNALADCAEFAAFTVAEEALKFAKENTKELNLARHAVNAAKGMAEAGLDMAKWVATHGGKIVNLTKIEFSGSVGSLVADGPPLMVNIEGFIFGQGIKIEIKWQPNFNLVKFIKAIFDEVWELVKKLALDL